MKMNCDIIQDLLPLYEDSLCSPASRAAVDAHLKECPACRALSGSAELIPPVELPEDMGADRAVAKSIKKVRSRWLRALAAMLLVVPMLLLSFNQFRGAGLCFTNPDDIFTAWRFLRALETQSWEDAAAMTTYGADYDSILEALGQPVESWGPSFTEIELDGQRWAIHSRLDSSAMEAPAASALFHFVYNRMGSVMIPVDLWAEMTAIDPAAVEQEGRRYWINYEAYAQVTTPWGEFVVTDGLQFDSAEEYCTHIDLMPAGIYEEAADALRAEAQEVYSATHADVGYVAQMSKAEFEVYMTEKYAAELAELESLGVRFRIESFQSASLLSSDGAWNVQFKVTVTKGTESIAAFLSLQVSDGHVDVAILSHTNNPDWLYQVNSILYPSAHPEY